jgi:hypothetical protein
MYFKEFPEFLYDFRYGTNETKTTIVRDITRNVRFRKEVLDNIAVYDEYDIVDGETPEIIAEKIYGNPEYHWIIMLANQRYDYLTDFPLPEPELVEAGKAVFNPSFTATSWSYSGTTVTVTKAIHGLLSSPTTTVTLSGATTTAGTPSVVTNVLNGTFTITSVTANTFTFNAGSALTGTAGGTLTVKTSGRENYSHHYVNAAGYNVNSDVAGAVDVTNIQWFRDQNEEKRRIKIISPQIINKILTDYKDLL